MSALGVGWEGCGGTPLVMSVLGVGWVGCSSALLLMSFLDGRWEGNRDMVTNDHSFLGMMGSGEKTQFSHQHLMIWKND